MSQAIPKSATRTVLDQQLKNYLSITLGGTLQLDGRDQLSERRHHSELLGIHAIEPSKQQPIHHVEFTAIRGPHGTIPVRVLHPSSTAERQRTTRDAAALIYFHSGGYTVGSVDEFENGLRLVAQKASVVVFAIEYRLAPEWHFPVQLHEYATVLDWVRGSGGQERGIIPQRVCVGGDSAGGNMTVALALMKRDEGLADVLKAQILLYPEARPPFDTEAAIENNSGLYLECMYICIPIHHSR